MKPNPYEPPKAPPGAAAVALDRQQRNALAETVRRFLNEEITAFEFDELLDAFRDSEDSAVRFVAFAAWYHYDDLSDHRVDLSKAEWDYFQRLLLLLESDRQVQSETLRRWSWLQLVAGLALAGFLWIGLQLGWGYHWLALAIPFGGVSIGVSWLRRRSAAFGAYERMVFPFETISDLKAAYDAVGFRKVRYPRHLPARKVRSPLMSALLLSPFYVLWLMFSPLVLLFQTLPQRDTREFVVSA